MNAAVSLNSLRVPPGNRLEQLKGNRKGQYSIRINDQWRICFFWKNENAYEVEITEGCVLLNGSDLACIRMPEGIHCICSASEKVFPESPCDPDRLKISSFVHFPGT